MLRDASILTLVVIVAVLVDISVKSCRKLVVFIKFQKVFLDTSVPKTFHLFWKTKSLPVVQ